MNELENIYNKIMYMSKNFSSKNIRNSNHTYFFYNECIDAYVPICGWDVYDHRETLRISQGGPIFDSPLFGGEKMHGAVRYIHSERLKFIHGKYYNIGKRPMKNKCKNYNLLKA